MLRQGTAAVTGHTPRATPPPTVGHRPQTATICHQRQDTAPAARPTAARGPQGQAPAPLPTQPLPFVISLLLLASRAGTPIGADSAPRCPIARPRSQPRCARPA